MPREWMKLPATVLLAMPVCLPMGASAQVDNYTPYHEQLARECPARHLEWVSPGDLDLNIAIFEESLPKNKKLQLDRANAEKTACATVMAGLTCGNVASLKAMSKVGLLAKFAKSVCSSSVACRGQSDCDKPQP